MKEQELFELCKQVYEATGWEPNRELEGVKVNGRTPPYTSDYLLEKLPVGVHVHKDSTEYGAYRPPEYTSQPVSAKVVNRRIRWNADTPRKALLKLTLALRKEGLL